jgi:hypothetical protein
MKKLSVFSLIFSFLFILSCEDKEDIIPRTLNKTFGGSDDDYGYSVQQTTDGGYIIGGNTDSFGNGGDVYLVKTNSNGEEEWTKTFGGSDNDYGRSVQQTTDGGYVITGYTSSFGNGSTDVYLVKTNSNGEEEWTKTFGGSDYDYGYSVQQTTDGGYIIGGNTDSFGNGYFKDVYLIKTNSEGDSLWTKTFGGSHDDYGRSVQQTTDGGYIISGITTSFGNGGDVYLVKTNSEGDSLWTKTFGGSDYDYGRSVQQTTDGGYIISGYTFSFGNGSTTDVYLVKTNSNGEEEWTKTFGGSDDDYGYSVQQTTDGGYIIGGNTDSFGNGGDVYLVKTNSEGDSLWTKTFGGSDDDYGRSVQQKTDGGYIISGYTESFGNGYSDVYLIKTDSDGNLK